jgi:hypothetical protein
MARCLTGRSSAGVATCVIIAGMTLTACADDPMRPSEFTPDAPSTLAAALVSWVRQTPGAARDSACATVVLRRSGASLTAVLAHESRCQAGRMVYVQEPRVRGDTVRLRIALRNESATHAVWKPPMALVATAPALDQGRNARRFAPTADADAPAGVHASARAVWSLDRPARDSIAVRVPPGRLTDVRDIDLVLPPATDSLAIALTAYVTPVVRGMPPDLWMPERRLRGTPLAADVAAELRSPAIRTRASSKLGPYYARNYLTVAFKAGASLSAAGEILARVGGEVVARRAYYLVRFPPDVTEDSLLALQRVLEAAPITRMVFLYDLNETGVTHIRPNDGGGWARGQWRLDRSRTQANTPLWALGGFVRRSRGDASGVHWATLPLRGTLRPSEGGQSVSSSSGSLAVRLPLVRTYRT